MFYRVNPAYPDGSWGKLYNLEDGNTTPYDSDNAGYYNPIIALVEEMWRVKEAQKAEYKRLYNQEPINNNFFYGLYDDYQELNFYDLRGHIMWQRDHVVLPMGNGNTHPARQCVNRTLNWLNEKIKILISEGA